MQLYLLRHGIAEDARANLPDADRALTAEGKKKLRQVLRTAAEADVKPTLILSSPYRRALETAQIAKKELTYGGEVVESQVLTPNSRVEQVWEEVRHHRSEDALLLAGHNPLFEYLAGYLLGNPNMKMEFKKGALLRVDLQSFGEAPKGILRWCLTAKLANKSD